MLVVFSGPKLSFVSAPCLVNCDNVPRCVLKFSEEFVNAVVGAETAGIFVKNDEVVLWCPVSGGFDCCCGADVVFWR